VRAAAHQVGLAHPGNKTCRRARRADGGRKNGQMPRRHGRQPDARLRRRPGGGAHVFPDDNAHHRCRQHDDDAEIGGRESS